MEGGWGDGTLTQAPSTTDKHAGSRAWSLTLAGQSAGDHKLMLSDATGCAPGVTPGRTYDLSAWYKSSSPANALQVFIQDAAGSWSYWTDVDYPQATTTWAQTAGTTPVVPAGTQRLSFGVAIGANGTVLTDDYSMRLSASAVAPSATPTPTPTVSATPTPSAGTSPTATPTATASPVTQVGRGGTWSTLSYSLPHRAIHSTVLRTGKVLLIAGSGNDADAFAAGSFTADLWDPTTGTFTPVAVPEDMFCSGHVTLPNGNVLIMGGTKRYMSSSVPQFEGLKSSYVFDITTSTFTRVNDAQEGHWYPTLTKLGSGDVWAAGGYDQAGNGSTATEMFSVAQNRWLSRDEVPQSNAYWGTYPHMVLMGDGRLFYSGAHTFGPPTPGTGASIYDWRTGQILDVPGLHDTWYRDQAGSVLLPPAQDQKVGIFGGGSTTTNEAGTRSTDVIDLKAAAPAYHAAQDLPGPGKGYVNTVLLPNRTVLTTGGALGNRGASVRTAAVFDPRTETWLSLPDEPQDRGYHTSAFLIPDGRVVVIGGNPADNTFNLKISVFTPTYAAGARPVITAAPSTMAYGGTQSLSVTPVASTNPIDKISLLAPMSVTHQTDPNARLVDVPFVTNADGSLTMTMTSDPDLAPPGPYMLVAQDASGVPSVARWVDVR